jgi:ABC-type sugar transport system substrate-binding protein
MCYIGLDNYTCGQDTAKELVRIGGNEGNYVVSGNWGASDTDEKYRGLTDYLSASTEWKEIGRVDDKAVTEDAIKAATLMFNTYSDIDGVIGLDASSGTGIGIAIEDMGLDADDYAIVVHGREEPVLDFIERGIIDSTIINKTALCAYMAIQLLESYNKMGMADVPIANNNKNAKVTPFPEYIYMGSHIVTKENVVKFMPENIPQYR